jgi:hypothetical protein
MTLSSSFPLFITKSNAEEEWDDDDFGEMNKARASYTGMSMQVTTFHPTFIENKWNGD